MYEAEIESGDPRNDQMAARATEDLAQHVGSTKAAAKQTNGDTSVLMALIASAFIKNPDAYPRDRLASILAAALVDLAHPDTRGAA